MRPSPDVTRHGVVERIGDHRAASAWRQVAVGAAVLALGLGLLVLVWLLAHPLALLFGATVIAEALSPTVARLERRLPRTVAVAIVYLAVAALFTLVAWAIIPPLVGQAVTLLTNAPQFLEGVAAWASQDGLPWFVDVSREPLASRISQVAGSFIDRATNLLLSLPLALISSTFEFVLVLGLSLYWLIARPVLRDFTLSLFPASQRAFVASVMEETGQTMGGFVRGVVINASIVVVLTYVGLVIIGVDFPLVLALIAGLGEIMPIVGPWLAAIPAVGIALLDSPTQALIVAAFYFALQQFEGYILVPNIMRQQAAIPPWLGLFALFAGASLGGVLGALIALPLAGAIQVLTLRVVAPAVRHWTGAAAQPDEQPPQQPTTVPPTARPADAPRDGLGLIAAALLAVGLAAAVLGERRSAATRPPRQRPV